jgi:RNA polymerase sigma-70 factor (ECF subfamily)
MDESEREQETDSEHDAQELARLVRFITRPGRRFGLGLATYVSPSVGEAMRQSAIERVREGGTRVGSVEFAALAGDVIGLLARACEGLDVLFVTNLDPIAYDTTDQGLETRVLMHLNLRRDELPDRIDVRVVFWLIAEGYPQAARLAWDLLMVANTRFEFVVEDEREPEPEPVEVPMRPSWLPPPGEIAAEVLARQAAHFADAANVGSPLARAEAAASAGRAFAAMDRFSDAIVWLRRAAEGFEQLGPDSLIDATQQYRRLAEIAGLLGDEFLKELAISRSLLLVESSDLTRDDLEREWIESSVLPRGRGSYETATDMELIRAWQKGDRKAGSEFIERHFAAIRSYFLRRVGSDYDDPLQDTFARFAKLIVVGKIYQGHPRAALFSIARVVLVERLHKYPSSRDPDDNVYIDDIHPDADNAALEEALQNIPLDTADLLELRYVHDLSGTELAELFEVPEATIQSRLHTAMKKLQQAYRERSPGHAEITFRDLIAWFALRKALTPRSVP